jgi:hypothetical protein
MIITSGAGKDVQAGSTYRGGDNHEAHTFGIRGGFVIGCDRVQQSAGTRRQHRTGHRYRNTCSGKHGCAARNDTAHCHLASNRHADSNTDATPTHHWLDA